MSFESVIVRAKLGGENNYCKIKLECKAAWTWRNLACLVMSRFSELIDKHELINVLSFVLFRIREDSIC